MAEAPKDIEALIALMARLPGLGPRSARRAVLHLLANRTRQMAPLAEAMAQVAAQARDCTVCGNIGTAEVCEICAAQNRANGQICVVEDVADLWAMERGGAFGGRFHVLGGTLSALDGVGPTTAHYLADALRGQGVAVTGLARGVPVGGELDYLDEGTISAALGARRPV
ncbi:MAG: recombination protein RecR [Alphaproteobacteria bacterium HGW-Alphaproteobacteria-2]|nr:MAG: recombination protein RecR [Alphaproteobacteria bacterium HGW-Alphaproteobacteria-2]